MTGCSDGCKQEFKKSNFLLGFEFPHYFVTSQWGLSPCSRVSYLVYRVVALAGLVAIVAFSGVTYASSEGIPYRWISFVTNWSFVLLLLGALLQCILAFDGFMRLKRNGFVPDEVYPLMTWYLKITWVTINMGSCSAFMVSILYWAALYPVQEGFNSNRFNMHTFNSIYVVINVFVTAVPVRIYHAFHTIIFLATYTAFSAVYQLGLNHDAIYPIVDWRDTWPTVGYAVGFVIGAPIVVWLIYYGLYRLRVFIFHRTESCKGGDTSSKTTNNHNMTSERVSATGVSGGDLPLTSFRNGTNSSSYRQHLQTSYGPVTIGQDSLNQISNNGYHGGESGVSSFRPEHVSTVFVTY